MNTTSLTRIGPRYAFLIRFFCVYLLLYAFPFPLGTALSIPLTLIAQVLSPFGVELPGLLHLDEVLYHITESITGLVTGSIGKALGIEVLLAPTGSGDTAHYFLKLGLVIAASLLIATFWQWRRKDKFPATKARWLHAWGRWWLAAIMIHYGSIKVFGQQFWVPNAHELTSPLGDYSPMHLAWAFMGHSPSYQCLAGLAELIPAILILHRRTALLGLCMMLGVLSNVFAMNLFFDIPVKLASGHYLLANLLLLLPYWPRIQAFLKGQATLPVVNMYIKPERFSQTTWSKLSIAVGAALVLATMMGTRLRAEQMKKMLKPTPYAGRWTVLTTKRDGAAWQNTKSYQTVAIDQMGRLSFFDYEGEKTTFGIETDASRDHLTLRYPFRRQKDTSPTLERWSVALDTTTVDGHNNRPTSHQDRLKKIPVTADRMTLQGRWNGHDYHIVAVRRPLPIEQEFRWVQEAPFQY